MPLKWEIILFVASSYFLYKHCKNTIKYPLFCFQLLSGIIFVKSSDAQDHNKKTTALPLCIPQSSSTILSIILNFTSIEKYDHNYFFHIVEKCCSNGLNSVLLTFNVIIYLYVLLKTANSDDYPSLILRLKSGWSQYVLQLLCIMLCSLLSQMELIYIMVIHLILLLMSA